VTGSVGTVVMSETFTQSAVPGHIGIRVDPSAVISGGLLVADASFSLVPGQYGYAIAHAATFSPPALVQISGASNSGQQDVMFRQTAPGVTDMDVNDDRLVVKGGPSASNWTALTVVSRFDALDPLIVDCSTAGAGVDTLIPYEDGAGNLEMVASTTSHFAFFKNAADPLDWYFEYTASLTNATIRLASDVLADRTSAGPSLALLSWHRAPFIGPGYGAYAPVPDSVVPWENTNSLQARSGLATFSGVHQFDRFRPVISDSSGTDVRLSEIKLDLAIGS